MSQKPFSSRPFTFGGSLERRQSCITLQTIREACNRELRLAGSDARSASSGAAAGAREDGGTLDAAPEVAPHSPTHRLPTGKRDLPPGPLPLPANSAHFTRLPWTSESQANDVLGTACGATMNRDMHLFPCGVSITVHAPYTALLAIQRFPGSKPGESR
ncbi:hypothetical protein TGPRC2_265060 [Toxoplasma gondii TgCatPRC2]|uniref:Uncharacterized protein n=3 Tax=Toxoplasma gondii TaxID=5811 RepID=A0A151H5W8_TOXGO|nr:hypothetical protein TGME49_265060 [Toxoplasma gondii ME49]EPT27757.1 hypothetical protein TGME49_265060 [Toxoplasma gondii ME49]KYF45385.1 hypothetical protein TGARI_265060 [Toxoplasma gondii ARI]KYK64760.1 hypothetical protein TGPRC2_265060 [Toxoplasma gondii TgCatPRC2]|eukprot:XP_018636313.1 hypothetical protein TGME49_265060 [Toxoplasma gondii ME49]